MEISKMRLTMKLLLLALFAISLSFYDSGCSSAEQTTAMLAFKSGDFEKAEREFLKELQSNPSNEEAWYYLAASRIALNKLQSADSAFKQYRKLGKNTYASEILDAWVKRYNTGADNFEKGQKTKDQQEQLKLYTVAKEDFTVCFIILPDSTMVQQYIKSLDSKIALITVTPFIDKGVEYINAEKFEDAVGEFKKALETGIEKGNAAYETVVLDLSIAYSKWGAKLQKEEQDSIDAYKEKHQEPDSVEAYKEKYKLAYKEKYKLALPYLEEIKNTTDKQNKLIVYQLLVAVYGNLGMNDEALEAIKMRDKLSEELKTSQETGDFAFQNVSLRQNEIYIKIIGEVTAKSESYNQAVFKLSLFDSSGKLLETVDFVVHNIKKGETKSFDAITTAQIDVSKITNYKIQFDFGN